MGSDDRTVAASRTVAVEGEGEGEGGESTVDEGVAGGDRWAPQPGDRLVDRYELLAPLGAGAHGSVFEAYDELAKARVAVKIVQGVTPQQRLRLRREFRALVDANHPNLVMLYELYADDANTFFTMELVEGLDFIRWVRGSEAATLDVERLHDALVQLAHGLSALHHFGLLHRDLKPANVLVRAEDGRVKLVDFGLAVAPGEQGRDEVVGTPLYMSPEQAVGMPIGRPSDWYAVGAIAYEALAGQAPLSALSGLALLAAKQTRPPPMTPLRRPGVPDRLAALTAALLAVPPGARPTAEGVFAGLGVRPQTPGPSGPHAFFGRRAACRVLDAALRRPGPNASCPVVVIEGGPGIGKSALLEHFARRLHARGGYVWLQARCFERESVPHKGLDDLVDRLRSRLELEGVPVSDVPGAASAVALFPILGDVVTTDEHVPADPVRRRQDAGRALAALLGRVAGDDLLVVAFEDVHWFDRDSAQLLRQLVAGPGRAHALFVLTTRGESGGRTEAGRELVASLLADGAAHVGLGGMEAEELAQIVSSALAGRPDAADIARAAAAQAAGSPLLALELARGATSVPAGGRGRVTLEDVVADRVEALDPAARQLLRTIAVAGRPIVQGVALRAADVRERTYESFAVLRGLGLIRTDGTTLRDPAVIGHERVGKAVVAGLDVAQARGIHDRLAHALQAADADPQQVAYHYARAGQARRAAQCYAEAARRAAEGSAYHAAAQRYADAIALAPDAIRRAAWTRARAEALADAGLSAEAGRAFLAALDGADEATSRLLRQRAAEQLLRAGQYRLGVEQLRIVLRELGLPAPGSNVGAWAGLALGRLRVRRHGLDFASRTGAAVDAEALARVDACWTAATGLLQANVAVGYNYQTRHLLLALQAGEPRRVARALAMESLYAATAGDAQAETARGHLQRARALADACDDPHSAALSEIAAAGAAVYRGRFDAALAPLAEAEARLRAHGRDAAWELSMVSTFRVMSHWYRGDMPRMLTALDAALADARAREDVHTAIMLRVAYAPLADLVRGRLAHAREELAACRRELPDHLRHSTYRYVELLTRARLCRYAKDAPGALAAFRGATGRWGLALLLQRAPMLTFYEHDRGISAVAAATEAGPLGRRRAVAIAHRSVAALTGQGTAWAMAMARPIRAGLAALEGDASAAAQQLQRAREDFTAVGMRTYASAVAYRAAELSGDPAALAVAERELAAQGIVEPHRMVEIFVPPIAAAIRTGPTVRARKNAAPSAA